MGWMASFSSIKILWSKPMILQHQWDDSIQSSVTVGSTFASESGSGGFESRLVNVLTVICFCPLCLKPNWKERDTTLKLEKGNSRHYWHHCTYYSHTFIYLSSHNLTAQKEAILPSVCVLALWKNYSNSPTILSPWTLQTHPLPVFIRYPVLNLLPASFQAVHSGHNTSLWKDLSSSFPLWLLCQSP